jgi:polysaccharide export outer membrane protein
MVLFRGWLMRLAILLPALLLLGTGCANNHAFHQSHLVTLPPPGTVPTALNKVSLPQYVIEPPDLLAIEIVNIAEIEESIDENGKEIAPNLRRKEVKALSLPVQPVSGQFSVRPDGTVYLGIWGAVPVAGLTLDQARDAIVSHVMQQEDPTKPGTRGFKNLRATLDVLQYNSKRYYVIFDGGGNGEQVIPFPVTGSETVIDAIANVQGLPAVASKRNVWVARRSPFGNIPQQILPVDWVAITQHGNEQTDYQILPGDRVYVKAQRLVTLDTTLARIIAPIERVTGIILLGSSTANQLQGRGQGFNN